MICTVELSLGRGCECSSAARHTCLSLHVSSWWYRRGKQGQAHRTPASSVQRPRRVRLLSLPTTLHPLTSTPSIFKPAEHNPLLELLLARGVNGESLSRANSPRRSRSRSTSPGKRGHARTTEVHKPSEAAATSKQQAKRRKSQAAAGRAKKQVIDDTTEEAPTAGSYRRYCVRDHCAICGAIGSSRLAAASEPAKKGRATKATKKQTRPGAYRLSLHRTES